MSGPLEEISIEEARATIHKMKNYKSTGPTGVAAEMLKASREGGVRWTDLLNAVVTKYTGGLEQELDGEYIQR